jgi:acetylornithine deacetylase/succinyl-diaminopimelate desuccinylase-like protein
MGFFVSKLLPNRQYLNNQPFASKKSILINQDICKHKSATKDVIGARQSSPYDVEVQPGRTHVRRDKFSSARSAFGTDHHTLWPCRGRMAWKNQFSSPYDLHFSIVIDDAYNGIKVIDGQPSMMEAGYQNFFLIKTNRHENALPAEVKVRIPLEPPPGMSRQEFAQKIIDRSQKFSSYAAPYSFPKNLRESKMRSGEYNSSSYVAGLLRSVIWYVPFISTPGYQVPGWENPLPLLFFKGEAIR